MSEAIRGGGHESQRRRKKQRERDRGNGRSCQNWCMCAFTSHYRAVDRNSSIAPRRASPGPSSDSVPALCAWLCVSGPASGDSLSLSVSLSLAVSRALSLSVCLLIYTDTRHHQYVVPSLCCGRSPGPGSRLSYVSSGLRRGMDLLIAIGSVRA